MSKESDSAMNKAFKRAKKEYPRLELFPADLIFMIGFNHGFHEAGELAFGKKRGARK